MTARANSKTVAFCNTTNSVDDRCFIIIVRDRDKLEELTREFNYARVNRTPHVLHKYALEYDLDQYHIEEVCVFTYNKCDEYIRKLMEITDSLPNCINSTQETNEREQDKYEASKVKCFCGATVLRSSMQRHVLTLKHQNAVKTL